MMRQANIVGGDIVLGVNKGFEFFLSRAHFIKRINRAFPITRGLCSCAVRRIPDEFQRFGRGFSPRLTAGRVVPDARSTPDGQDRLIRGGRKKARQLGMPNRLDTPVRQEIDDG